MEEAAVKKDLASMGNVRSFKPDELDKQSWKEVFKNLKWDNLKVEISNENSDKIAVMTLLNDALKTVASFAGRPMTPDERLIFNKILSESSVISPIQLSTASSASSSPMPTASPPTGGVREALQV